MKFITSRFEMPSLFGSVCWGVVIALLSLGGSASADDARSEEFFEKRVRPVLVEKCLRCHGGSKVSGGLRVDSREALLKGGESGLAINSKVPTDSLLLKAIRRADDVSAMPPDKPLEPREVEDLTQWITAGALWPKTTARFEARAHWAFQPLVVSPAPAVRDVNWPKHDIDRFVLAKLEAANQQPQASADRRALLRRVTFDLTGLPPTPAEVEAFVADTSPNAFAAVVDRLLQSPHYGEHWGRRWLDLVRYADTAGENSDHPLPHAWRYRNWVIDAYNRNLPYDEFVRQQFAGDLIAAQENGEAFASGIVATGYLAIARRFGHEIDKEMHLTHEDIIDNLGKTFLGLTLGCCRCHDHKYDTLSMRDYYGLMGIFESTKFSFPGCEPQQQPRDLIPLLSKSDFEQLTKPLDEQIARTTTALKPLDEAPQAITQKINAERAQVIKVISTGLVDDAQSAAFPVGNEPLKVSMKRGEYLSLSITPRANHGADTTRVEFEIVHAASGQRWSVLDLVPNLLAGNPHADQHGNASVWCFIDFQNGFKFLGESLSNLSGRGELHAWKNGDTPSVFVNSSDQPVKVWTELPAKAFFMHPGQGGPVALAWISPVEGEVTVRGKVADAHPGGDGVGWVLEQVTSAELGNMIVKAGEGRAKQAELRKQIDDLTARRKNVPVAYAVTEGTSHHARLHKRGEPTDLGDEVPRKFLDVLGGQTLQQLQTSGRLELGQWLTDQRQPLLARVFVNRLWQGHFGRGLVATPNDFGVRGSPPSHPELLDYLAADFIKSGWDIKRMHRQLLLTATYQTAASDSAVELFGSFARRRLTAEELRDALLSVSAMLDRVPGTTHPFPPENTWSFSQHGPFAAEYDTAKRSVYVMQKRNRRSRYFALFDGADPNASTPVRDVTTVPTQALFFMNDGLIHSQAAALAGRAIEAEADPGRRVNWLFLTLFGRPASDADRSDALDFISAEAATTGTAADQAKAWTAYTRVLLSSNEFLYVD